MGEFAAMVVDTVVTPPIKDVSHSEIIVGLFTVQPPSSAS
jgi:hypothetical protein